MRDVRSRLILAGIQEIEEHGLTDFSLRRVAAACEVSCAAPYKHFKSKDDLILEIIRYINEQWELLQRQIVEIFEDDLSRQLVELSVANIRFWIANPNFRSVLLSDHHLMLPEQREEKSRLGSAILELIRRYCADNGLSPLEAQHKTYRIRSMIYGAVLMLDNGELENNDTTMQIIRQSIEQEIIPRTS